MNPRHCILHRSLLLAALVAVLFGNISWCGADVIYISFMDRRGYTRPDTVQNFDSVTLTDLGAFTKLGVSLPEGLAFDSFGNLYVANYGNNTVSKFTRDGVGSVFAQTGVGPIDLAFDKAGNLYVANYWDHNIQKFTTNGVGTLFASSGIVYPKSLTLDSVGNLYVASGGDLTIQKFTPQGIRSLFANTGPYTSPLGGLACDASDNIYLGCQATNTPGILKFTPSGVRTIFAIGNGLPTGLDFDSAGNLCAANYGSDTIAKYSPDGVLLTLIYTPMSQWGFPLSPWGIAILPPCRLSCPTNVVVGADPGQCGAIVYFTAPATTNCSGLSIESTLPPGSFFPIGTNAVTWSARGSNGKIEDSCNFEIVVQDRERPTIHGLSATPNLLWPPNHAMRPVHIAVTATDNCGLTTAKIISVTSNELITGTGGGPGNKDWELTGQLSLNLRAERSGNATDRIYTIAVECTDVSGNSTTRTIAITVPHSQSLIRGAAK